MHPDDISSNAPGVLVQISRELSSDDLYDLRTEAESQGPVQIYAFVPDPLPPKVTYTEETIAALGNAMFRLGQLDYLVRDLPNPYLLIRPFIRREAVASSRIEGMIADLEELVVFEEQQDDDRDHRDVREVANYVKALEYGLSQPADRQISTSLIRELHHLLLQGVRGSWLQPGCEREQQVFIGNPNGRIERARYVPPPPHELHGLLHDLDTYIASESPTAPLIRIALVHYQFEAIHPFLDGNGRTGRLLIALLLRQWGTMTYPVVDLSAYVLQQRDTYIERLHHVSQKGDWEAWIAFFLEAVGAQAADAAQRGKRLLALRETYRLRLASEAKQPGLDRVIDALFEHLMITIRGASELLDVTFPTARRFVGRLEEMGILEEATGRKRDRVYRAREVIAVLDNREPSFHRG